ncbi:hypothetical protein [Paraflavitalea sp. CAU 1676]|uniref:hypothetical protein n=1 Tax=Paraflavitalea sp. CAU 1676 TaxID=3032598 RepID=UPI0023DC3C5D|nr:hypothetical protein [Paraflavitalea sp. CAU 1676]MDF2187452.1 hypothetical protein [Paraflavitalea sp. CAU 1676]
MENQDKKKVPGSDNDVDLGTLFQLAGNGFSKLTSFFRQLFIGFGNGMLFMLIFLKRRMWWILGALLIGYGWGTYQNYKNGVKYYSTMTARFHLGSTKALYHTIDYLNNMISAGRSNELAQLLSISKEEAASLRAFEAEAIVDEKEVSDLYRKQFLSYNRGQFLRTDTFWTRVIPYKDFKAGLTKFDYPLQEISVVSTQIDVFPKIQQGFINAVTSNGDLKKNLAISQKIQLEEEAAIVASLQGLDTLRTVYNEKLRKLNKEDGGATTNVNLSDKSSSRASPELELFDKLMQLKDELKLSRQQEMSNTVLVQVYASFSEVGRKSNILRQGAVTTALQALALLFVIFLIYEIYNITGYYEKKQKSNQG